MVGPVIRVNPLCASKAVTQKGLTWDLPQRELLALSSVLQVLVCVAGSWWELAEVVAGGFLYGVSDVRSKQRVQRSQKEMVLA